MAWKCQPYTVRILLQPETMFLLQRSLSKIKILYIVSNARFRIPKILENDFLDYFTGNEYDKYDQKLLI